jgi:hypothetical protein
MAGISLLEVLCKAMADKGIQRESDAAFLARIAPSLVHIESIRKSKYDSYVWRRKASVLAGAVLGGVIVFADKQMVLQGRSDAHALAGFMAFFAIFALLAWVMQPQRAYVRTYKKNVIPQIAQLLGLRAYEEKGQIPLSALTPTKILPAFNVYNSEDYFEGSYKGAEISFAQVEFKERRRSGKNTYEVVSFKGMVILIILPRQKFYGHTILVKNQLKAFEWLETVATGLKRANLVDPVFESVYSVFTNDQVEARYLLDPAMMERVTHVSDAYKSRGLSMACFDSRICMLLASTRNYFEPPDITIPATDAEGIAAVKREIEQVLELIDYLDVYRPAPRPEGG